MVGTPVIAVSQAHLGQMFALEPSEIYGKTLPFLGPNCVDVLISPLMDAYSPDAREHFKTIKEKIIKPGGFCIEHGSLQVYKV